MLRLPLIHGLLAYDGPVNLALCRRGWPLKFSQSNSSSHLHRFRANLTAHDCSQEGDAIALEYRCWAMHCLSNRQSRFQLPSAPLSNRGPWFAQTLAALELRCGIGKCLYLCDMIRTYKINLGLTLYRYVGRR